MDMLTCSHIGLRNPPEKGHFLSDYLADTAGIALELAAYFCAMFTHPAKIPRTHAFKRDRVTRQRTFRLVFSGLRINFSSGLTRVYLWSFVLRKNAIPSWLRQSGVE